MDFIQNFLGLSGISCHQQLAPSLSSKGCGKAGCSFRGYHFARLPIMHVLSPITPPVFLLHFQEGAPSSSSAKASIPPGTGMPLLDLDDGILGCILSALGPEPCQLAAVSQTCKRLHRIAHGSAWKALCYKVGGPSAILALSSTSLFLLLQ
jgi:hypothetical protein